MSRWTRLHRLAQDRETERRRELGAAMADEREARHAVDRLESERTTAATTGADPAFREQYLRYWNAAESAIRRSHKAVETARARVQEIQSLLIAAHLDTKAMQVLCDRETAADALAERRRLERDVQERSLSPAGNP